MTCCGGALSPPLTSPRKSKVFLGGEIISASFLPRDGKGEDGARVTHRQLLSISFSNTSHVFLQICCVVQRS
jgi:hypothetical protein